MGQGVLSTWGLLIPVDMGALSPSEMQEEQQLPCGTDRSTVY